MKKQISYKDCFIAVKRVIQSPWLYNYRITMAELNAANVYASFIAQQGMDYTKLLVDEGVTIEK